MINFLDPHFLISTLGLIGVFVIIFAESGILVGLFFPGDSLLFLAGVFAADGYFSLPLLIVGSIVAAILGDNLGYWIGKKIGPKIFIKEESFFFKKSYLTRTQEFYIKHGNKNIALARFVPIVRTIAPLFAGVAQMNYKSFFKWNVFGGCIWVLFFSLGGFLFGKLLPDGEKYLSIVSLVIVGLSLLPYLYPLIRKIWK